MRKICPVCNSFFEAKNKRQIYCSEHCRKVHHKLVYYDANRKVKYNNLNGKIIRKFICRNCYKMVVVTDKKDKRKKFCCPRCEKLYWKHPEKYRIREAMQIILK